MKIAIASVLILAMGLLIFCIAKIYKEKHRLARTVSWVLILGLAITLCNTVLAVVQNEMVGVIAHCAYFVLADWMLYYLFNFSVEYIGSTFSELVNKKLMKLILIADNISILCNIPFRHQFTVEPVEMMGETFNMLTVTPFFFIHYAVIAMLLGFTLVSLFYRAFTAPVFYRRKYMAIAVILLLLALVNIGCLFLPFDFSVIGFAVEGVCIYYCSFVYTPQRLISTTLMKVSQEMNLAVYVLDSDGNKLYANGFAEEMLNSDNAMTDREGVTFGEWCGQQFRTDEESFAKNQTFIRDGAELILKVQFKRMEDYRKQFQGGYFVIQDITEEYNKLKKERYLASHDELTGLYNKNSFCEIAQRTIKKKSDLSYLVVCTDFNSYKMINDFFGTETGDKVLVSYAGIIRDMYGVSVCGRLGEDIFALLIAKEAFSEKLLTEAAQQALTRSISRNTAVKLITCIGVCEAADSSTAVSVLCDRALLALHSIKSDYRTSVAYYDSAMRERIRREQELMEDIDTAFETGQLKLYLQAIVTAQGSIMGAEALVQWHHPTKGRINPKTFLALFEHNGLISEINCYIWDKACMLLRKWRDEGVDGFIAVKVSIRDFYYFNLFELLVQMVKKHGIQPSDLVLEVSRGSTQQDINRQMEVVSRLRQKGFTVWMDEFGSGQSSLDTFMENRTDMLKIDLDFVKKSQDKEINRRNLDILLGFAGQLNIPLVAKGIDRQEQVDYLSAHGCRLFQGDYFKGIVAAEDFTD